jgi:hypothetical protein
MTTTESALHYGNARRPMVRVAPDDNWPGMWRLIWPDGELSDMANLSRIKDAAAEICDRGPPRRDRRRFHWEIDRRESRTEGAPVRFGKKNDAPPIPSAQTPLPERAAS